MKKELKLKILTNSLTKEDLINLLDDEEFNEHFIRYVFHNSDYIWEQIHEDIEYIIGHTHNLTELYNDVMNTKEVRL